MKKIAVLVAVIGIFAIVGIASAFDLPSKIPTSVSDVKNTGAKLGLQTALNKKLESNKCAFKPGTDQVTCDMKKLTKELAAAYNGIKEATNYNVYINIEADDAAGATKGKKKSSGALSGYDRANTVSASLKQGLAGAMINSWYINTKSTKSTGDALKISAEVK